MICIYHSRDLDGFTSGAIVKRKYPEAKLIGFDYGQELPMDEIPAGEPIIMIDVSLRMGDMHELAIHSGNLLWIDHHISAINDYSHYVETITGNDFLTPVLKEGIAACELAWIHFFPDEKLPTAVNLLGEYDTWRNGDTLKWENAILPFQYGMRNICISPETFPTHLLDIFDNNAAGWINSIILSGETIISYNDKQNERLCKQSAFEVDFEGYKCICVNQPGASSQTFKSVYDESKHDIMMPFFFNGNHWVFSLYTTKEDVDCSMIAKKMGGGGHRKAAGFQEESFEIFFKSRQEI